MKRLFALCVILTMTLTFYGLVAADITVTRVTNNLCEDTLPQIKGNYVVWQEYAHGDWEIFLYDVTTGVTTQITENSYDDTSPQTDGNNVVWLGYNRTGGEIFVYHIGDPTPLTSDENAITSDTNIDCSPQIADGRVVWTSHQVGDSVEPGEIFLYDIKRGRKTKQLTDNSVDDSAPRINEETVMWVQDSDAGKTIFIYDLPHGPGYEAPEGFVWEDSPQTDGNLTVLARYDGNDREIFLYDSNSRRYHQINPDNELEDRYPRISGNHIAWVRGEGQASEIYLAFYDTKRITLVSPQDEWTLPEKPPTTFSWNSSDDDKFKIQFSDNLNFDEGETLTFPSQQRKWLAETSFTPKKPEWSSIKALQKNGCVFWRVKVKDADPSEAWSFSIQTD